MNLIKRPILGFLRRCGYAVLKTEDYQRMSAIAAAAVAPRAPMSRVTIPSSATFDPNSFSALPSDADFQRIFDRARKNGTIDSRQAFAIYSAIRYLTKRQIPGDILDCGDGNTEVLELIASILMALGETGRRLVLFDVTGDPTHRAETRLTLWGSDGDALEPQHPRATPDALRPVPKALSATGYPIERIEALHFPKNRFDLTAPLALVCLTTETYASNLGAIAQLIPLLSAGGVIGATGQISEGRTDAVGRFLQQSSLLVQLWQITPSFRIGTKCG